MSEIKARILKAIYDNCSLPEHRCEEITDAVLAALKLTAEQSYGTTHQRLPVTDVKYTRYVTDWKANGHE